MVKQTNLSAVKDLAMSMLYPDIEETPYSPIVVKHPFTDTGIISVRGADGQIKMIELSKAEGLAEWRAMVAKQIGKASSAQDVFYMLTKPYYFAFIKYAEEHLSSQDLSEILATAWVMCEQANLDPNISKREMAQLFRKCTPKYLMEKDELIKFFRLTAYGFEMIPIFRGVTSYNASNVKALSWSLSKKTAEWFAHRYNENGTVYSALIPASHILAYFAGRGEDEIVVDPSYLSEVKALAG